MTTLMESIYKISEEKELEISKLKEKISNLMVENYNLMRLLNLAELQNKTPIRGDGWSKDQTRQIAGAEGYKHISKNNPFVKSDPRHVIYEESYNDGYNER